jgi:GTP-binding protein Era
VVESSSKNAVYLQKLQQIDVHILLIINKIDLSNQQELEQLAEQWRNLLPKVEIFPVSALEKFNLNNLFNRIVALLPPSPPWYGKEVFTDRNYRFFASEIIREKILMHCSQEVPYCTEVVIEQFKEHDDIYRIEAVIHVMRDSQKGLIIGARGSMLKKIGTMARIDMEAFFDRKVFLRLFVKVAPNWREDRQKLKQFGYVEP